MQIMNQHKDIKLNAPAILKIIDTKIRVRILYF